PIFFPTRSVFAVAHLQRAARDLHSLPAVQLTVISPTAATAPANADKRLHDPDPLPISIRQFHQPMPDARDTTQDHPDCAKYHRPFAPEQRHLSCSAPIARADSPAATGIPPPRVSNRRDSRWIRSASV